MSLGANRQAVERTSGLSMRSEIRVEFFGAGDGTFGEKLVDTIGLAHSNG